MRDPATGGSREVTAGLPAGALQESGAGGEPDTRPTCWTCRRPESCCLCSRMVPQVTRTRFVILMHPKEARHTRANTGRLTHLCLPASSLHTGVDFSEDSSVQDLVRNPGVLPVLLYPSKNALSAGPELAARLADPAGGSTRTLLVIVLDATWSCARTLYRSNPWLHDLPCVAIHPDHPSRYRIKRQPDLHCLSTMEAVARLLEELHGEGLEDPVDVPMFHEVFEAMQAPHLAHTEHGTRQRRTEGLRLPSPLRTRQA